MFLHARLHLIIIVQATPFQAAMMAIPIGENTSPPLIDAYGNARTPAPIQSYAKCNQINIEITSCLMYYEYTFAKLTAAIKVEVPPSSSISE